MKNSNLTKKFIFRERHVRYNYEVSPNSSLDNPLIRYHFVIVDDRFLDSKPDMIVSNFQDKSIINFSFEKMVRAKGKFKDTGLEYLFVSYDSNCTPKFLDFKGVSSNILRDKNLKERKVLTIEDYVRRVYEE